MEILASQSSTLVEVLAKADIHSEQIADICISNQRETAVLWDKESKKPIYNAIMWHCSRTADICEKLKPDELEEYFRHTTSLVIDPYFAGTKVNGCSIIWSAPSASNCCAAPSIDGSSGK